MNSAQAHNPALYPYEPDYAVPPGEILSEVLEEQGMTQVELARRLGISVKHLNQVISGAASLSSELAILLERVTGVSARLWNGLEANYQDFKARLEESEELAPDVEWLKELPVKDMIKRGYIEDRRADPIGQLREVLAFFGVARRATFDDVCASAAYRKSKAYDSDPNAIAVWLRAGEREATDVECNPFDKGSFRTALTEARALTQLHDPSEWLRPLKTLCQDAGVALVLIPEIGKTRLSGAARWLSPEKALIQLSLRGRWAEAFWFTFFHEAGHILLHSKKRTFIDDGKDTDGLEEEANAFARDFLIPPRYLDQLATLKSSNAVRAFARDLGIGTGIVAGRLHKENLIPPQWFTKPDIHPRYVFKSD